MAATASVPDQSMREHRPVLAGEEGANLGFHLVGVGLRRPSKPTGQSAEVGVHGDARDAERVTQHDVCGLSANPRQGDEVLEPSGNLAVEVVAERLAEPDEGIGLGPEEPGRLDQPSSSSGSAAA